jgi:hypothetical protein
MKRIENNIVLMLAISMLAIGCNEKEVIPGRPDAPEGPQATISIDDERLGTGTELFVLAADDADTPESELSTLLDVESNYSDWTVAVTGDAAWCKVFTQKDTESDRALIEFEANDDLTRRSAVIRFSAGKGDKAVTKDITVTQFGVSPEIVFDPASPINVTALGETINITVGANAHYTYEFSDPVAEEWITDVTPPSTRAIVITSRVLSFTFEENEELNARSATLLFTADAKEAGEPFELVFTQLGSTPAINIDGNPASIEAAWDLASTEINVVANVPYAVTIEAVTEGDPTPAWITQAPATRAFESKTLSFNLTQNPEFSMRSAVIVLKSTDGTDVEKRLPVNQAGHATLSFVSTTPSPLTMGPDSGNFSIVVTTNVPSDDADWDFTLPTFVTKGEPVAGPSAGQTTFNFSVSSSQEAGRSGDVVISYPGIAVPVTQTVTQTERNTKISATGAVAIAGNIGSVNPAIYIDGNKSNSTDTNYSQTFQPTTFDFKFDNATIDQVVIFPRANSNSNGTQTASGYLNQLPKVIKFAYSTTDAPESFTDIAIYSVDNAGSSATELNNWMTYGFIITFPESVENVNTLKFMATESYANFICMSEVEFYRTNGTDYPFMEVVQNDGKDMYAIPQAGDSYEFTITSNIEYDVTLPAGFTGEEVSNSEAEYPERSTIVYRVTAAESDKSIGHGGRIVFKGRELRHDHGFNTFQAGNYFTGNTPNGNITATAVAKDPAGTLVSSEGPGEPLSKAIDGDITAGNWSAKYNSMEAISATNPVIMEFKFNDTPSSVSMVRYVPRNSNGDFMTFKVFVKPVGGEYPSTPVYEKTATWRVNTPLYFTFPTVSNPESVKIEVTTAYNAWPSAREIQFFQ